MKSSVAPEATTTATDALVAEAWVQRPPQFSLRIALTVPRGVTTLLGPSGSGKSTTLDVLAGHVLPSSGRITIGGELLLARAPGQLPTTLLSPQQRRIGYVMQHAALFPHLTVAENLRFGLFRLTLKEQQHRLQEMAEQLALTTLLSRRPAELSGGERQRVALGRALLPSPRALLLDEPLSAVDLPQRQELLQRLQTLLTQLQIPVLYVTHSDWEAHFWSGPVLTLQATAASSPEIQVVPLPRSSLQLQSQ